MLDPICETTGKSGRQRVSARGREGEWATHLVTLLLREVKHLAQRLALHALHREHARAAELVVDARDPERPAEVARLAPRSDAEDLAKAARALGLADVVALVFELAAHRLDRRAQVEALGQER